MSTASTKAAAPACLPPLAQTSAPRIRLPAGATDCHCHVFEDPAHFPYVGERSYEPQPSDRAAYRRMADTLGITRTVQVSASVYGADNRLTLEVIADWGQHRARGVAGLSPDATTRDVEHLHIAGMRGVRLSTAVRGYGGPEALAALAKCVKPFGWHLQLHLRSADEIAALEDTLMAIDAPLVFDHMGSAHGSGGTQQPGFQALLRILQRRDDAWTKISSWYRRSASDSPHSDMRPLVEALVENRPDRLVFGTNWPHPALFAPQIVPDDGALVDAFHDWIPDAAMRHRVLVDNPAVLYGFDPMPA